MHIIRSAVVFKFQVAGMIRFFAHLEFKGIFFHASHPCLSIGLLVMCCEVFPPGTPDYEAMASLGRMVAQCGPGIEEVVKQRKTQDPNLWYAGTPRYQIKSLTKSNARFRHFFFFFHHFISFWLW